MGGKTEGCYIFLTLSSRATPAYSADMRSTGMEPLRGFEPRTYSLQVSCSTTELKRLRHNDKPRKSYGVLVPKAIKDENEASCSLDDRPALLLRKSTGRNVRAPWERLVGNAHLPVTYPVKADTDQCHRDEPRKGSETPRSTEVQHSCFAKVLGWQTLGGARRIWVFGLRSGSAVPITPPHSAPWRWQHLLSGSRFPGNRDPREMVISPRFMARRTEPGVQKSGTTYHHEPEGNPLGLMTVPLYA